MCSPIPDGASAKYSKKLYLVAGGVRVEAARVARGEAVGVVRRDEPRRARAELPGLHGSGGRETRPLSDAHPLEVRSKLGHDSADDLREVSHVLYTFDGTGADGPRSEGGKVILDNSRVYVRFLPFGSGRVHLGRLTTYLSILDIPLEPRETATSRTTRLFQNGIRLNPASISDATIQMDHNAVVLFTIDRLARSPRTTVRTRGTELAPDQWFIK